MNIALVLAGGRGSRMNSDMPKQYIEVNGKMIIEYCLETLFEDEYINGVIVVAGVEWREIIEEAIKNSDWGSKYFSKFMGFSMPGENRQLSIFNGLTDIVNSKKQGKGDKVLVHDAARPMLSHQLIKRCFEAFSDESIGGVLPVIPMKDTIYVCGEDREVTGLMDRNRVYAGQAPEVFDIEKYYEANISLLPEKILSINGSTEPAVMAGMNIVTVDGEEDNFKITTQKDLDRFRRML